METVQIASRSKWRAWLRKHHKGKREIWLVFFKKHTGRPTIGYDEAVEEALCFGWIDSVKKRIDDERYAFKFTPRKPNSKWSASNKKRVRKLLAENRLTTAGLACVEAAKQNGSWDQTPVHERITDLPEELGKALARNKRARLFFASLTPAQQRQFITWVGSAKKVETRKRRAAEAIDRLRNHQKLGMK